ncbi:hypothetical protein ANCCEY_05744 [Ancylostoma ceylanicum]|uniref:Signal peptidase complex subunit 1 n=1 Tax=Ancylostoma ceylanicum TaxID=53326 RepID=A0A0D6LVF6_9BILA|nr:hypothetical protein ANCCEY_05744 [Ancylostoma ceylanicum]
MNISNFKSCSGMDGIIQMLPEPLRRFSTHMDFPGQKAAERTFQVIIVLSGIIGFLIGFSTQQLSHAIYTVLAGAALSALIVLPPWPFLFRKNPIVWQPVTPSEAKETKKTK